MKPAADYTVALALARTESFDGAAKMPTTEFHPTDTRADPARIRNSAERLQAISGVLLGHGDEVGSVLSQVALSFSEVIAPAIAAQIGDNRAALETAVEGTQYGYAVGTNWAQDVEEFIAARAELITRWELAEMDDFGVAGPANLWPGPEPEEAERLRLEHRVDVADARSLALDSFIREGHALWEAFQDKVIETGRMFREGPTVQNLSIVVSVLGWGAMTLWPEIAPPPVSAADGVTDGATVLEGLDGTAGPQAVADALADVAAIIRRAEAGQELTPGEIDYLEAFYETMGQRVTEVPEYLAQSSFTYTTNAPSSRAEDDSPPISSSHIVGGLDPATVSALTAASANGMLVLSRSGPGGGGYSRLPTWVRDALDGDEAYLGPPTSPTSPPIIGVDSDFRSLVELGEFFEYSSVEAGTGLSHQLAIATQNLVQMGSDADYLFVGDVTEGVLADVDSTGRSFLYVVARNDEASFDLLMAEDMPASYDATTFFADIYGFEWSDDGAAAAGLTDFILEWETNGTADQSARADVAMARLIDITTSDELFSALMDDIGTSEASERSALGQVNPAITAHFGELMATYFDELSGLSVGGPLDDLGTLHSVRFATLICTDDASAGALTAQVDAYERAVLGGFPSAVGVNELAGPLGRLHGILDSALMNSSLDVTGDQLLATERAYQVRQFAFGLGGALGRGLPSPFSIVVGAATEAIAAGGGPADVVTPGDLDPENFVSETLIRRQYDTSVAALQSMIDAGLVNDSDLAALAEQGLVNGSTVVAAPAGGTNVEEQTDLLVAAADAAATEAGLAAPPVQVLIGDIEDAYEEIVRRYQAENVDEYENMIEG